MELYLGEPAVHLGVAVRRQQVLGAVRQPQPQHVLLLRVAGGDLAVSVVQRQRCRCRLVLVAR